MIPGKCHLCGGGLFRFPVLSLDGMPKAAQYYPTPEEFSQDEGVLLEVFQCSNCSLVQLNQEPVEYFREVITAATLSEKAKRSRLHQMQEFAAKFNLVGEKVLEIGSGSGAMLDVIAEAGMNATGLEAGEESVAVGLSHGRRMLKSYIGDLNFIPGNPYSAFVCLNFLEHLPRPGEIIKKIAQNTTNDAVGFVTVPNFEYLLKSRCFYEFVADHLSYFTQATLTFAFASNGFEVLKCDLINEDNDIAITVRKRQPLDISAQYSEVEKLIVKLQKLISAYRQENKKIAVWGAGHRTLALLALGQLKEIEYIVDSASFKQGCFSPVLHLPIVPPEKLISEPVDLVIIMVPGLYPDEVYKTLKQMELFANVAMLRDNQIEFR